MSSIVGVLELRYPRGLFQRPETCQDLQNLASMETKHQVGYCVIDLFYIRIRMVNFHLEVHNDDIRKFSMEIFLYVSSTFFDI